MLVTFYETARGDRPVEEFIDRLSAKEAAKVLDALAAIEAHGLETVVGSSRASCGSSRCRPRESSTWS
jgi:hypothetical protein